MKKKLYYVIEKQLQDNGDCEETNGWKNITVYSITDNIPVNEFIVEAEISDNSVEAITNYLEDNGMGDDEYEFIQL
jgi:hypothetical protein